MSQELKQGFINSLITNLNLKDQLEKNPEIDAAFRHTLMDQLTLLVNQALESSNPQLPISKYKDKQFYVLHHGRVYRGICLGGDTHIVFDGKSEIIKKEESKIWLKLESSDNSLMHFKENELFETIPELLASIGLPDYHYSSEGFSFDAYEKIANVKDYGVGKPIEYPTLKLNGEAGEVAEKVGKVLRDNIGDYTQEKKEEIMKELGDVLWYIMAIATDMGYTLSDVAQRNIEKITDRRARKVTGGSGDNR